jgi:hypothetical protein
MQVTTTVITSGADFRNKKMRHLPAQVEQVLADIAVEQAESVNNFAVSYISTLEQESKVGIFNVKSCSTETRF